MIMKKLMVSLLATVGAATLATPASAAVVFLDSVVAEGEFFRFNYVVEFANQEGVTAGSSVAIYDFQGYVAGSVTSTNPLVDATVEFASMDLPPSPDFTDDPTVFNLRFTYTGQEVDLSGQSFGGFSALSRYGAVAFDGFSGVSIKTGGFAGSTTVFTQGSVGVPAVPEPAVWAMMIGGFGAIGAAARRRRQVTVSFA
jgi:hypothetical protein